MNYRIRGLEGDVKLDGKMDCAEAHGIGRHLTILAGAVTALALAACSNGDNIQSQSIPVETVEAVVADDDFDDLFAAESEEIKAETAAIKAETEAIKAEIEADKEAIRKNLEEAAKLLGEKAN